MSQIDTGKTIFVPVIWGKRDYFFIDTSRQRMFRKIKRYLHLTRRQFFQLGHTTDHVFNPKARAAYFGNLNVTN